MPIVVLHAALLGVYDLDGRLGWVLALVALAPPALILGRRLLAELPGGRLAAVLGVAALLRLLALPLPPSLSDDVLRYVWDGRVAAAGANPYRTAPESEELAPLRDDLWRRMPHKEVETVYPPLAVTAFSLAARLPNPILAWKILLALADLAGCLCLARLARRLGRPVEATIWYAWNPLAVVEITGMGHVEGLGVAATVAAALAVTRSRAVAGALWTAAAVLAKLVPLALVPAWALASRRPWRFAAVALGVVAVAMAPVVVSTGGVPPGWQRFGLSWEFNGPLFEPLWRALDALDTAPRVKEGLDALKAASGRHDGWDRLYPFVYPQLLAKLILAAGFAVAFAVAWARALRDRQPVAAAGGIFGWLVIFSATVYPWYLLWILPWASLAGHRAWLAAAALAPLAYLPRSLGVPLYPWVHLAMWGPVLVLLVFDRRSRWSTD